ncbi:hypothetical protein [Neobittarella massiliensis]|uniref:Uncharacterized protein n=2 Tax=Oscillospiraceae TaxID=216572 RepID=A0A8J6INH4_9FIRM|nr:hypothetical protein [Neobittarella massiliensis]MBC3515548.1 hypothetical protein [Neobittarella massiliensis]SCJ54295.1 Uncharacterised protein [uncultured Anaerotruncus sp.]
MKKEKKNTRYQDLYELIDRSEKAHQLFAALPQYVQGMIGDRAENVHTYKELSAFADNLTAGDD